MKKNSERINELAGLNGEMMNEVKSGAITKKRQNEIYKTIMKMTDVMVDILAENRDVFENKKFNNAWSKALRGLNELLVQINNLK